MNGFYPNQRGTILVVVLFLAALLGVFAAVAATIMNAAADSSRSFAEDLRAKEAMRAAIEQVVAQTGNGLQQTRGLAAVRLAKAQVALTVRDEASRIDLNKAKPELLAGIFRVAGVEDKDAAAYAARIVDWRDEDDKPSPNGGAERGAYRSAGRVDGPRNGPFLHVSELALVLGIPPRVAAAVAPYMTVSSGREQINPMIADPPVLLALPGVNPGRIRDFLERREQPGAAMEDLISRLGSVEDFVTSEPGLAVRFDGLVRLGPGSQRRFEVVVGVLEGDKEPYRILAWDSNPPQRTNTVPESGGR